MCGLGGILRIFSPGQSPPADAAIPEQWLDAIDGAVMHRGPDGRGRFRDRVVRPDGSTVDVALVHRRLSIIDHQGGGQPLISERPDRPSERAVAVVFNGCIYNHRELRSRLIGAGRRFATDHADTEVLIHGWREWGHDLFERIDGMIAAAIWDSTRGELILVRDRFGEKPLYVRELPPGAGGQPGMAWAFSSIAGVLADRIAPPPELDADAILEWLGRGYSPLRTPWKSISQLAPSTTLTLPTGAARSFAPIPWAMPGLVRSDPLTPHRVEALIERAVADRLDADVPVACLLSGGVDSSLISLMAARAHPGVTTVCVRMPDERYDESEHAAAVASAIGADHITIDAPADPAGDMVMLLGALGLPFGDSSLLPTHWAFRAAAAHAGVVLTGDGGDEMFMGYERYTAAELMALYWPLAIVGAWPARWLLSRRDPRSVSAKLARFSVAASHRGYRDLLDVFASPEFERVTGVRPRRARNSGELMASSANARRFDVEEHLPGDYLRKVDHASMVAAVETRAPMLARGVADAALRHVPAGPALRSERKALLKRILRRHVPASIVDRPKMGFAIPIGEWFRTDYGSMRALLHDHLRSADPFPGLEAAGVDLRTPAIERMLDEHDAAGHASVWPWKGRDHGQRLYALLSLSIWARGRGGPPLRGRW